MSAQTVSEIFDPSAWREVPGFGFTDITYHRAVDQGTVRIAFNRPEVRNAFRPGTVDELYRALDHARMSTDVGCVIITGNGPSPRDGGWAPVTSQEFLAEVKAVAKGIVANGVEPMPSKFGSPGVPMYGFHVKLLDDHTGEELTRANEKGVLVIEGPLPPGCLQTLWGDDARFVNTYWKSVPGRMVYSTFDWGVKDEEGYFYILGRTDDVINVAGHRLGTREIEESIASHPNVAEVAVVGVADALKGQVAMAFVVAKDATGLTEAQGRLKLEGEIMKIVDAQLGAVARPARVLFLSLLPKTRSGKLLRRAIQAVCEQRDPGDLTTIDDPTPLQQIKAQLQPN